MDKLVARLFGMIRVSLTRMWLWRLGIGPTAEYRKQNLSGNSLANRSTQAARHTRSGELM